MSACFKLSPRKVVKGVKAMQLSTIHCDNTSSKREKRFSTYLSPSRNFCTKGPQCHQLLSLEAPKEHDVLRDPCSMIQATILSDMGSTCLLSRGSVWHLSPPADHRSLTVVTTFLPGPCPTATACACSCVLITSSGCSAKLTTAPDADPAVALIRFVAGAQRPYVLYTRGTAGERACPGLSEVDGNLPETTEAIFL